MIPIDKKYKLVPPDGGYGYVICVSMVVMVTSCISHVSCFGMLYNDFFNETGTKVGTITIIVAVASTVVSVAGIAANVAVKKYNLRKVAIAGAMLYTMGWVFNIFITTAYQMIFSFGILQGAGLGILMTTVYTSFNEYFEKKRVMMMSICQVAIGVGAMLYPLVLEKLLKVYGFRGTLLIQTGIVANTIFSAVSLQPVRWHTLKVLIYEEIAQDEAISPIEIIKNEILKNDTQISACEKIKKSSRFSVHSEELDLTTKAPEKHKQDLESHKQEDNIRLNSLWTRIVQLLDLDLLKDSVLLNIILGVSFGLFTDMCFVLMFPLFLYSIGLSTSGVADCLSIMAGADLLSRAFLAILSKFYTFQSRSLFFYVLIALSITRIVLVECKQYWTFMLMASALGFLRGLLNVPVNLIYAEYIPEKFIAAYGLSTFFMGNITTVLNPLMGILRDITDSYVVVFYALSFISLLCIVPWTIEFLYFKRKSKCYK